MNEYWDKEWKASTVSEYKKYINPNGKPKFFDIFIENKINYVCDAACGFGAFSVMLSNNGFVVSGFDVSKYSVNLTKNMLENFNCSYEDYKTCSITDIYFNDETFDAVVAHAVIDHLSSIDAKIALDELFRITKKHGLIYLSFDRLEDDDIELEHVILEDGSFLYSDESRDGLLFKYYTEEDIKNLIQGKEILYYNTTSKGDREVVLRK